MGKRFISAKSLNNSMKHSSLTPGIAKGFCEKVNACLRSRMEWSDQQLMRDIICVLATQGWEKIVENLPLDSVERIVENFSIPLHRAQANCDKKKCSPFYSMPFTFVSLSTLDYRAVWWRLFDAPSSSELSASVLTCFQWETRAGVLAIECNKDQ